MHFPHWANLGSLPSVEDEKLFPSEFQKRTLWRAVTGLAILVLGALLVGLIWLTSNVLGYLQPVLVPLAVAGIVAYLLDPIVQKLQKKGFSRMKGIITVFSGFLIFFAILGAFIGVKLSGQLENLGKQSTNLSNEERLVEEKQNVFYGWVVRDFFSKDIKAVNEHLENGESVSGPGGDILAKYQVTDEELSAITSSSWSTKPKKDTSISDETTQMEGSPDDKEEVVRLKNAQEVYIESSLALNNFWLTKGGALISSFRKSAQAWIFASYGKILGVLGMIIGFAMVPIYLYYFLKESDSIKEGWEDYVPLRRSHFKTEVVDTLREINGYLISFFRGQVLVAFIDGILVGIALTIYGLNYGLLIGVVMAMLGIIPFIGNILCLIPACIIAYFQYEIPYDLPQWGYSLGVVIIFVVVQQINSLVTAPKIVGDSVGLHPMTVIFSMLFWSLILGGFLGALLAVPLTAAVKVLFRRYVWDRQTLDSDEASASTA